ncbi:MAG: hypothetical protein CO149_07225 [Nitrospirae bacterium CG_4_9_14_3_um_filter_51_5]|nr:MAG: hypothetical protein CO149_07225 [Nitrospirae bacterium CG_4_9_14_3_um_filter_51_5]
MIKSPREPVNQPVNRGLRRLSPEARAQASIYPASTGFVMILNTLDLQVWIERRCGSYASYVSTTEDRAGRCGFYDFAQDRFFIPPRISQPVVCAQSS